MFASRITPEGVKAKVKTGLVVASLFSALLGVGCSGGNASQEVVPSPTAIVGVPPVLQEGQRIEGLEKVMGRWGPYVLYVRRQDLMEGKLDIKHYPDVSYIKVSGSDVLLILVPDANKSAFYFVGNINLFCEGTAELLEVTYGASEPYKLSGKAWGDKGLCYMQGNFNGVVYEGFIPLVNDLIIISVLDPHPEEGFMLRIPNK